MAETTEVAIIGGGAAGCAVAYYLAEAGVKSTIIEREGVGSQASGFAAGGLNPLQGTGIPGPLGAFAWESFLLHRDLSGVLMERTGIDYQRRTVSQLKLAFDEGELGSLQDDVDRLSGVDEFEARWVEPGEVYELEPRIGPGVLRGVYARGNQAVDSLGFIKAMAAAASAKAGSTVRPGSVRALEGAAGQVSRVVLEDGELDCGQVVLAMGPWSRRAEAWLDTYLPVDPLKGEILRLDMGAAPLKHDISGAGASLYPKLDGLVWCGTTEDWRGFDREPLKETRQRIMANVVRCVPDLAGARLDRHTACLRPVTPDWLPILGLTPGWDNVYQATGAGKKGILLAPAIGKSVAELMTVGETALSVGGFRPDRFAS